MTGMSHPDNYNMWSIVVGVITISARLDQVRTDDLQFIMCVTRETQM